MINDQERINQLLVRLDALLRRQNDFSREINNLRVEIDELKTRKTKPAPETEEVQRYMSASEADFETKIDKGTTDLGQGPLEQRSQMPPGQPELTDGGQEKQKSDFEKFVGENLINKIGIIITVIGVAIGAKYSIEHDLVSPLTRIVLGYLAGVVLLGFGMKLKTRYESYSAVLVSGAMTVMYFITFAAYDFYGLLPQALAFGLMVLFTAFTVMAAINYNRQVIAHIGLVGAYAVPFLLSDGSGRVAILFTYMAIINVGILVISFKRYWKSLYYSSFGLSWLIYSLWYTSEYRMAEHFVLALIFLLIFFATFYVTFLVYKLLRNEKFEMVDIFLLLVNSFIFYGIGYLILDNHKTAGQFLGMFTLCNAIIHFAVSTGIFKRKLGDRSLFYMVSGLVLVFITIAIPVQLDGNWVTLLWAGEAALLFWIGRTKNVPVYEKLAYPLMMLAFFSLVHDWMTVYGGYHPERVATRITPLLNINFLTSVLVIAAFGFINALNNSRRYVSAWAPAKSLSRIIGFSLPAILLVTTYYALRMEIATYWDQLYIDSALIIDSEAGQYPNYYHNSDLINYKAIWLINYSLAFLSILALVNFRRIKSHELGVINLGLFALTLTVFLVQGLYVLSELRESYLEQVLAEYYRRNIFNIGIRYISFAIVALALVTCRWHLRQEFIRGNYKMAFDFLLHTSVLWIASSELMNWMDIADSTQSYKLGLSILWGMYSMFLIAMGIWKRKRHLRIGAIVLFGVTLLKLFFYDISHLDTIAKTIVLVSLGGLLLLISFLYNKYKHIISDEVAN